MAVDYYTFLSAELIIEISSKLDKIDRMTQGNKSQFVFLVIDKMFCQSFFFHLILCYEMVL